MATHSSILAWRIPQTEEPGGLQSVGSHRIGHNCTPASSRPEAAADPPRTMPADTGSGRQESPAG